MNYLAMEKESVTLSRAMESQGGPRGHQAKAGPGENILFIRPISNLFTHFQENVNFFQSNFLMTFFSLLHLNANDFRLTLSYMYVHSYNCTFSLHLLHSRDRSARARPTEPGSGAAYPPDLSSPQP